MNEGQRKTKKINLELPFLNVKWNYAFQNKQIFRDLATG